MSSGSPGEGCHFGWSICLVSWTRGLNLRLGKAVVQEVDLFALYNGA